MLSVTLKQDSPIPLYRQIAGQIEAAIQQIELALSTESPKTETGDPARLKATTAALDEITRPLADYIMDKVMEQMLRDRGALADKPAPPAGTS